MATVLPIDFIADVVCPWCYIGWRRLDRALALRPEVEARVRWRPFMLAPELPEEGMDRATYYAERFPDRDRARTMGEALQAEAALDGLTLRLSDIPRSPNTNAAHRLIRGAGGADRQDEGGCGGGDASLLHRPARYRRPGGAGRHRRGRRARPAAGARALGPGRGQARDGARLPDRGASGRHRRAVHCLRRCAGGRRSGVGRATGRGDRPGGAGTSPSGRGVYAASGVA